YINPFGGGNPLLTKETESEPIIWDIGDEEEEYPFVNEYPSFKKEPIMFVEDESCPVYDTDNEEEELMPVYDTDIEDFIEEEEGFVGKEGFAMLLMVKQNRGEHLILRFVGRGNEPDPRDVKIASLKQRIQELEFSQLQQARWQKRQKLSPTSGMIGQRT
ncbi:hypothetical protein Tco_1411969, partial [Tanacetum coccineum]